MLVNNNSANQNKGVAYVRVSSQKQAEEGVSIAAQIKRIKEYAKFKGIILEDEDILIEKGVSGGIPLWERPMGGKLKRMLNSGSYEHVITMKLDRMFRLVSDMDGHTNGSEKTDPRKAHQTGSNLLEGFSD